MDMDVETKRQVIMKAYASDSWEAKVKAMSDSQVIAIYLRFKRERKI